MSRPDPHEYREEARHEDERHGHDHTAHLLKRVLEQLESLTHHVTTIERKVTKLMSEFEDYAVAQEGFNQRMSTAIDAIKTDVEGLNQKIIDLENNPASRAKMAELKAAGEALAAKVEAVDELTPPAVPPGGGASPEAMRARGQAPRPVPASGAFHTIEQNNSERTRRAKLTPAQLTPEEKQRQADWDAIPVRNA